VKKLSYDQIKKLPIGSIFYYRVLASGGALWNDIVQVTAPTYHSGPIVKVIFSFIGIKPGTEGIPRYNEINKGRAVATNDKKYMIDLMFAWRVQE